MRLKLLIVCGALSMLFGVVVITATAGSSRKPIDAERAAPEGQLLVVRVYYVDRAHLIGLLPTIDVWAVYPDRGYLEAGVTPGQYFALLAQGYHVEIDRARTAEVNRPRAYLPDQTSGIPGYPCYLTVEETYTTAQTLAADYPTLAQWIDIGDSWEKVVSGGSAGYSLMVLKLTNQAIPGPKPKLFVMSSIHAREYAPAELNTRFGEYLVNHYGSDPDVTWLLDYNEIHLLLQANPDGRKEAETGILWRKNTDTGYCPGGNLNVTWPGADLNRNFPFQWGCCGGSSGAQCDETYRGPSETSEPETQAVVNDVRSLYPVQRNDNLTSTTPLTATGVFVDLHSYGERVLWPWGFTYSAAPNGTALQTLGRKFAYFNHYTPQQSIGLYPTDGTTDDFAYGELGVAAYTFEVGTDFFQDCPTFENTIYPDNLAALLYAAKSARQPYQTPAGPDTLNVTVSPTVALPGQTVLLTATADDSRYDNSNGIQPTYNITAARYTIDAPSWITSVISYPMLAADGSFNSLSEALQANVDTSGLTLGRHTLFVESQDAAGNWGSPTAVFVWIMNVKARLYLPLVQKP